MRNTHESLRKERRESAKVDKRAEMAVRTAEAPELEPAIAAVRVVDAATAGHKPNNASQATCEDARA